MNALAGAARRVGATELRTVVPGTPDYRRWIDISADAYPIVKLQTVGQRDAAFSEQADLERRQPEHRLVGAYRNGRLCGAMRCYDFTMCLRGVQVFTGGVGSVAVALEDKRRGIARDLMFGFMSEYRERDAPLATLFAFRPAFYGAMGFGFGAKLDQYRIALASLPGDGRRDNVRRLRAADIEAFCAAYARAQFRANGLMRRETWRAALRLASDSIVTYGYDDGNGISGYLSFEVLLGKAGTTNRNELFVHELIFEDPAALGGLLAFLRSQADQYALLIVNTQDPDLHFVFADPRNGSDRTLYPPVYHETNAQGIGVMYRVIDTRRLIEALANSTFGALNATVRLDVTDRFFEPNAGSCLMCFRDGRLTAGDPARAADVDLAIDVADLSALMMGSVRLRSLVRYGRATLSNATWIRPLDDALATDPPQCLTRF